jgi:hypothetical protein
MNTHLLALDSEEIELINDFATKHNLTQTQAVEAIFQAGLTAKVAEFSPTTNLIKKLSGGNLCKN